MNIVKILKALNNPTRLEILRYLKEPTKHFPPNKINTEIQGVCVGLIQEKINLCQSTVSNYLSILENAGLVISERKGQWTYYRRNQQAIDEFLKMIKHDL